MAAAHDVDLLDRIMDYEDGGLDAEETLDLFAELVANGMAWGLQGHYGRTATALIDGGLLTADGQVTDYGRELVSE